MHHLHGQTKRHSDLWFFHLVSFFPELTRQFDAPLPSAHKTDATFALHSGFCNALMTFRRGTLHVRIVKVDHDPWICQIPTSGRPVDFRTADTVDAMQRDSRHANLVKMATGK
jgi:hypothetical protein